MDTLPLNYLEKCRQRYGDIFTIHLSELKSIVFIAHPQGIEDIFTSEGLFDSGKTNVVLQPFVGENSLILLDGAKHQQQRQLLMPPFHGERMHGYGELIRGIAAKAGKNIPKNRSFILRSAMQDITLDVILQVVFGLQESGDSYHQIKTLLISWLNTLNSPLRSSILFLKFLQKDWGPWSPWGRFKRLQEQINNLLHREIQQRRGQLTSRSQDILSLMLAARDEKGQPMTEVELKDELMTLLVAGHETTATALAWAFYWIYKLPRVQERLLRELQSLGDNPEPMAIVKLPY